MGMVPIAERPPEADDRRVPGHWEGDLLLRAGGDSAVATLVERQTRYVLLAPLAIEDRPRHPGPAGADPASARASAQVADLGPGPRARGPRAVHRETGIQVHFCPTRSPWQRGSKREHQRAAAPVPPEREPISPSTAKRTSTRSPHALNGRPRQTLGWLKPAEKMAELLEARISKGRLPAPIAAAPRPPGSAPQRRAL